VALCNIHLVPAAGNAALGIAKPQPILSTAADSWLHVGEAPHTNTRHKSQSAGTTSRRYFLHSPHQSRDWYQCDMVSFCLSLWVLSGFCVSPGENWLLHLQRHNAAFWAAHTTNFMELCHSWKTNSRSARRNPCSREPATGLCSAPDHYTASNNQG
jgi:hypothetical protein